MPCGITCRAMGCVRQAVGCYDITHVNLAPSVPSWSVHIPARGEHLVGTACGKVPCCLSALPGARRGSEHTPAGAVLELHHVDEADVPRAQLLQPPELRQRQAPVLGLRRLQRLPRLLLRMSAAPLSLHATALPGCSRCTVSLARRGLLVSAITCYRPYSVAPHGSAPRSSRPASLPCLHEQYAPHDYACVLSAAQQPP